MGNDFDRWLEEELGRSLSSIDGGHVAPRYLESRAPRGRLFRLLAAAPALITAQVAAAGIVAVAAATTGVAIHSVTSGEQSTQAWGQQVVQQVQKCKAALGADQHGIGQCVSQFASQHGGQQSDQNGGDNSNQPNGGNSGANAGEDQGQGKDNGNHFGEPSPLPTPHGKGGQSGSHPTPPAHPTPNASGSAGDSGAVTGGGTGRP